AYNLSISSTEQFVQTLKSFAIVHPEIKVDDREVTVEESVAKSSFQVRCHAFGEEFLLDLRLNEKLVPPTYSSEVFPHAGLARVGHVKKCFYSGKSRLHNDSSVALSNCHGLLGIIRLGREEYFIEPMKTEHGHLAHLLYRRSDIPSVEPSVPLGCSAVTGMLRRSLEGEVTLQLLVVVDKDMIDFHGNDTIEEYALTVMNMVSEIYRDPSIGAAINVEVVRLLLLYEQPKGLSITTNGRKTLQSFCAWQKSLRWMKGEDVREHSDYDAAVLITRKDICSGKILPCATVGVGFLYGMCDPTRRCSVSEDKGLNVAFTVAHELGHNLGIYHDGDGNSCSDSSGVFPHVMSGRWLLRNKHGSMKWSECSKTSLKAFLNSEDSKCLRRRVTNKKLDLPADLPGVRYSADDQCSLQYGNRARHCRKNKTKFCRELWCEIEGESLCRSKLSPPARGTACGADKSAHDNIGLPVDQVSLTPQYGGKYCLGDEKRHQLCNVKLCAKGSLDFRDIQCSKFNKQKYKGIPYDKWLPVISDRKYDKWLPVISGRKYDKWLPVISDLISDRKYDKWLPVISDRKYDKWLPVISDRKYDKWLPVISDRKYDKWLPVISDRKYDKWLPVISDRKYDKWLPVISDRKYDKWLPVISGRKYDKWLPVISDLISDRKYDKWLPVISDRKYDKWLPVISDRKYDKWLPVISDRKYDKWLPVISDRKYDKWLPVISDRKYDKWLPVISDRKYDKWLPVISDRKYDKWLPVISDRKYDKWLPVISDRKYDKWLLVISDRKYITYDKWLPVISDRHPCALYCRPKGSKHRFSAKLAVQVTDGTPCTADSPNICIDGKCHSVGCDHKLGSGVKEDRCGLCKGNGTTCYTVEGSFNQLAGKGYVEAALIPKGARNIVVNEVKPCTSFLALRSRFDRYYINGNRKIELPGEFDAEGTIFKYTRSGTWERLVAKGPTTTPLHIMVLYNGFNLGVKYQYTLPINVSKKTIEKTLRETGPTYGWVHGGWSPCSAHCDGGEGMGSSMDGFMVDGAHVVLIVMEVCYKGEGRGSSMDGFMVDGAHVVLIVMEVCYKVYAKVSRCDVLVSITGGSILSRTSTAEMLPNPALKKECAMYTSVRYGGTCLHGVLAAQHVEQVFNNAPCSVNSSTEMAVLAWHLINYVPKINHQVSGIVSTKLVICSGGSDDGQGYHPQRTLKWFYDINSKWTKLIGQILRHANHVKQTICQRIAAYYQMEAGCYTLCGVGVRRRSVTCPRKSMCSHSTKPLDKKPCYRGPCLEWATGKWTKCSARCGQGFQRRSVACRDILTGKISNKCGQRKQPADVKACNVIPCKSPVTRRRCTKDKYNKKQCHSVLKYKLCHDKAWYSLCCKTCERIAPPRFL
ncbi:hypothetical protein QZH41_018531, partial [Actinostola sp. cb2023]